MSTTAPRVVRLRLSGAPADIEALAALLASPGAVEVLEKSAPSPDRACLTLKITGGGAR